MAAKRPGGIADEVPGGTFGVARREAQRDGAPAIDLIDGEALCDILKERRLGVKVQMVEEVTVDETAFAGL